MTSYDFLKGNKPATCMIAVPTRGSIRWETVKRLNEITRNNPDLPPILYQAGNLNVALTRNRIVEQFMATDCQTLIMVDDDIVPPPHLLETLPNYIPEYAIVAIPHPMPHPINSEQLILTAYKDGKPCDLTEGINEVDTVATGCCAIGREVFDTLRFRMQDTGSMSDDFLFCEDLRKAGYKVGAWWDGWFCDHITTVSLAPLFEGRQVVVMTGDNNGT
ncbi:MAG TPA: hypothetical protein VGE97_09345 [Nitrososphaera sp.]